MGIMNIPVIKPIVLKKKFEIMGLRTLNIKMRLIINPLFKELFNFNVVDSTSGSKIGNIFLTENENQSFEVRLQQKVGDYGVLFECSDEKWINEWSYTKTSDDSVQVSCMVIVP
eukprot:UN06792